MVDYKAKQNQMFSVAKTLHESSGYICVPHSAYYACMQLIMYIWYYKLGKTEPNSISCHKKNVKKVTMS